MNKTKEKKTWGRRTKKISSSFKFDFLSERESSFSLESWEIRSSAVVGTRRKAALRREGFAWAPVLGVFDKLREVGVSSYLFYSWFKSFVDVCVGLRS